MKKISIKGVLIGSVVDIVLSMLLALPLSLYAISKIDFAHTPKDQIHAVTAEAIQKNVPSQAVQVLIGMGCSVLAGYVAASIAKHNELLNGALSSILCVAVGILSIGSGLAASYPLIVQIALLVASPLLGLFGGYLKLVRKRTLIPL
jgi:hypothetical protein